MMLGGLVLLSALTLGLAQIPKPGYEVVIHSTGALFVASAGPRKGVTFAIEGIHVEKSELLGPFNQVVVYEWKDSNHDGAASHEEFVPIQVFVDNPQAALFLGLVFSGIVELVLPGSLQVDAAGLDRSIHLQHRGSMLDLHIHSLTEEESSQLRIRFLNPATGFSFRARGAEYPAEAKGYALLYGLLFGESPAEPGSIKGFTSSGFVVPEAVISLSTSEA